MNEFDFASVPPRVVGGRRSRSRLPVVAFAVAVLAVIFLLAWALYLSEDTKQQDAIAKKYMRTEAVMKYTHNGILKMIGMGAKEEDWMSLKRDCDSDSAELERLRLLIKTRWKMEPDEFVYRFQQRVPWFKVASP